MTELTTEQLYRATVQGIREAYAEQLRQVWSRSLGNTALDAPITAGIKAAVTDTLVGMLSAPPGYRFDDVIRQAASQAFGQFLHDNRAAIMEDLKIPKGE